MFRSIWEYFKSSDTWERVMDSRTDGEEATNELYKRLKLRRS